MEQPAPRHPLAQTLNLDTQVSAATTDDNAVERPATLATRCGAVELQQERVRRDTADDDVGPASEGAGCVAIGRGIGVST